MDGKKVWFFPDGDIPPAGDGSNPMHGHESLILFNPNREQAIVSLKVYYEDYPPDLLAAIQVGAQRVKCVRTNEPIGDYQIPPGQYALKIESTTPIICQLGRADVRQDNLSYYTTMGYTG